MVVPGTTDCGRTRYKSCYLNTIVDKSDLYMIERLWNCRSELIVHRLGIIEELRGRYLNIRKTLTSAIFQELKASMTKRIATVLCDKGGPTRY
ncbi:hypothetical protein NPIL_227381 [Nephila pilipes]|uniref:Uncharacterized protein n=1 Tax=Nephila pilipes TaxID=299642 RepID=A0A8X6NSN9_NEPPI|nr:hypothetical protein NPIL_227381 [Nephila pilipes]